MPRGRGMGARRFCGDDSSPPDHKAEMACVPRCCASPVATWKTARGTPRGACQRRLPSRPASPREHRQAAVSPTIQRLVSRPSASSPAMGGAAFASGADALYTPRMPPAVYTAVRGRFHAILFALFALVATPVEGPGKADFGDVDVLLAVPHTSVSTDQDAAAADATQVTLALLSEAAARLGAVRTAIVAHEGKASLAVPWPADMLSLAPPAASGEEGSSPHIQVDLALAPSIRRFHWALFKHAHGDLWNILGSAVLRPLGLTIDERALWLRVPEIEAAHRSRAKVFLTDEPAAVLHFLGLRVLDEAAAAASAAASVWEKPFPSAAALFAYVTTSRFFPRRPPAPGSEGSDRPAETGAHVDLAALKSNDRRRMLYRPLFRQWVTEFMPAFYASARPAPATATATATAIPTREAVRDAAFAAFPGSEARFDAVRASWLRERHLRAIRTAAKDAVPADLPSWYHAVVCAAVRRRLGLVMVDTAQAEEAASAWTAESVQAHVARSWPAIAAEAAPSEHARYVASREAGEA